MDNNGECSKPKKSKSCLLEENNKLNNNVWVNLPAEILQEIFDYLPQEDRINASTVCKSWRKILFYPKWWPAIEFKIERDNISKAKFYSSVFGRNVCEAIIILDSLSSICIYEFINLLRLLNENNRLKSLILKPSHCRFDESFTPFIDQGQSNEVIEILDMILAILPRLTKFSLGGIEDLANFNDCIIKSLTPSKVTLLGLASIKDNFVMYEESYFNPTLISSFTNLQILSIDYEQLSDTFLYNLTEMRNLQRLIVHLHSIPKNHSGTTNIGWKDFKISHPKCLLRLTVIHAYEAIQNLHVQVLRVEMPLSHIKVFFCEDVNLDLLHYLSTCYTKTLRSVIWIDSINNMPCSWKFIDFLENPDPLVVLSWACKQFEELILYGYKYPEQNLVGIGRLKGATMKNLEIPSKDILWEKGGYQTDELKDVIKILQNAWNPIYSDDLHPVILDPTSGDSDEFLLPFVLADLH